MKRGLITLLLLPCAMQMRADEPTPPVRFGLRVNPMLNWFSTSEKNTLPSGPRFGYGFGLNIEFKLTNVAALLTGIGGDFESGRYQFRSDAPANYRPAYWLDDSQKLT